MISKYVKDVLRFIEYDMFRFSNSSNLPKCSKFCILADVKISRMYRESRVFSCKKKIRRFAIFRLWSRLVSLGGPKMGGLIGLERDEV